MQGKLFRLVGPVLALASASLGASFGTVVPVRGTVSDIALDERRNRVYAANFSAYRVETIDIGSRSLLGSLKVSMPPSAVAMSPDNRYLLVGEYQHPVSGGTFVPESGGYVLFDLDGNRRIDVNLGDPVLAVAFGADGKALILTRIPTSAGSTTGFTNLFVLDPSTNFLTGITAIEVQSADLPETLATFPAQIVQAAAGVSGDGKTIVIEAALEKDQTGTANSAVIIRYDVPSRSAVAGAFTATPPPGPRSVSVDQTGANALVDWGLLHHFLGGDYLLAQFPQPDGAFNIGSHAWDLARNLIYAQIPAPGDAAVLHVLDTDNLTVRERIQLPENLAGKSIMSSDRNTMYSASISGVTILPIGQLPQTPQVGALEEDVLFAADACNRLAVTQTLDLISLGSAQADFQLSLPQNVSGIRLSTTSGTTPAQVQITIDPAVFQGVKGTSVIPLTITSSSAVNLPAAVRLLINTRDFDQRGQIMNIPGKLVDMLADPSRNRLYLLRQDKNQVLVYDMTSLQQVKTLRTGNTPTQMAMTTDRRYLIVGADNSQIATVHDLNSLSAVDPIIFPFGQYPRTFGVSNAGIFATVRPAGPCVEDLPDGTFVTATACLDTVDFANRRAVTPPTLSDNSSPLVNSIYQNELTSSDGVLASSPDSQSLLLALPDGNVLEYDASAPAWVASRKDESSLEGAYAVFNGSLYQAGANLFNGALVPFDNIFGSPGVASGAANLGGWGILASSTAPNGPGVLQRWHTQELNVVSTTKMAEAPDTQASLLTPPVGQIGESILPFTRTLAVSADQSTLFALTISGLTIFPSNFDDTPPQPQVFNIVNSADQTSSVAGGGAININGSGLAPAPASAPGYPLPETLGEICVTVNNIALPLFSVSPDTIVAQLPFNLPGVGNLVIRGPGGISNGFSFPVMTLAPAIFHTGSAGDQSGLAAVYRDDNGEVVNFTNPVHPNAELTIYLTGLGATSPLPALGAASPSDPLDLVNLPPTVTLGGQGVAVTQAALTPGLATVYQVKVKIPGAVRPGTAVPLTIQQGSVSTTLLVRVVSP